MSLIEDMVIRRVRAIDWGEAEEDELVIPFLTQHNQKAIQDDEQDTGELGGEEEKRDEEGNWRHLDRLGQQRSVKRLVCIVGGSLRITTSA